jgi:hypothetical protein
MKTKKFLLLCLFIGIGMTKLYAQDWPPFVPPDGTKSMTFSSVWTWGYSTPVYCNNMQVDYVTGTAYAHCVWHYVGGVYVWARVSSHGVATGESGEVFKVQETDKEIESPLNRYLHVNLIGDRGSHYILFITWDLVNDPSMENPIVSKAVCVHSGKK